MMQWFISGTSSSNWDGKADGFDTTCCDVAAYKAAADASYHPEPEAYVKFAMESLAGHIHKVSGSMGSRYGVLVRGTLLARDFYTGSKMNP